MTSFANTESAMLEEARLGLAAAAAEPLDVQVMRFLEFRGTQPGDVIELQRLPSPFLKYPTTLALRTTDPNVVVQALAVADAEAADIGCFYIANRINPSILARSPQDVWLPVPKGGGTTDADVIARTVVYLDHDPSRPSGISSTDDEHALALGSAASLYVDLRLFFGESLAGAIGLADSGNGAHVDLALDHLPCDPNVDRHVKALLHAAHALYSVAAVKIDTSVGDPKRLCPAFGTMKRKGADVVERPHRRTRFWSATHQERLPLDAIAALLGYWVERLPEGEAREQIRAILEPSKRSAKAVTPRAAAPLRAAGRTESGVFGAANQLPVREVAEKLGLLADGVLVCPGCGETKGVDFFENGLKCFHDRCSDKGKGGFRTPVDLAMEAASVSPLEAARLLAREFGLPLDSAPSAISAAWDEPLPLTRNRVPMPFPVETLSPWLASWVTAEAIETQTPPDVAAMIGLAVCATALAPAYRIGIRGQWTEGVNLFTVLALVPGSRKSAVFTHGIAPISNYQVELAERSRASEVEDGSIIPGLVPRRQKRAPRLIADDTTPEALVPLIADNGGCLAILSSEGGLFTTLAGAYADKVNLDPILKGHGGESITVDRIGRPFVVIPSATITMGLTVQPSVLGEVAHNENFRARGLSARFLYFFPNDTLGRRLVNPPVMPVEIRTRYNEEVHRLLLIGHPNPGVRPEVTQLRLTEPAENALLEFMGGLEPRLAEDGDLRDISDWAGKLTGAAARIAALMHVADGNGDIWVARETIERSLVVAEYLIEHARAAFDEMGSDPQIDGARRVLKWLERTALTTFSKRDAFNGLRARFKSADQLGPVLSLLGRLGYVRELDDPYGGRGRPGSPKYEVNPLYVAQKAQKSQNATAPSTLVAAQTTAPVRTPVIAPGLGEEPLTELTSWVEDVS